MTVHFCFNPACKHHVLVNEDIALGRKMQVVASDSGREYRTKTVTRIEYKAGLSTFFVCNHCHAAHKFIGGHYR